MKNYYSIAIDGPSGSGKSTIAELIAQKLNILHLNSGSLYRAYAYGVKNSNIDDKDVNKVVEFVKNQKLTVEFVGGKQQTILNDNVVDSFLRDEKIGMIASTISAYPEVRNQVNDVIRNLSTKFSFVVEGRDIGSVVLPDSKNKFYLDATPEIRAKRRFDELQGSQNFEDILSDVIKRDYQDSTRKIAPLTRCSDAIYIDSSELNIDQVCEKIIKLVK